MGMDNNRTIAPWGDILEDSRTVNECIKDGRRITVQRLLWGMAQLGIGPKSPLQEARIFEDSWDFPSHAAALFAMQRWDPAKTPEPDGWHRHPGTGRYRIDGDKSLEYVKSDGGIE